MIQSGEIRYFKYEKESGQCRIISRCHNKGYIRNIGEKLFWVYFDKGGGKGVLGEIDILAIVPQKYIKPELIPKPSVKNKLKVYEQALKEIATMESCGQDDWWFVKELQTIAKEALNK